MRPRHEAKLIIAPEDRRNRNCLRCGREMLGVHKDTWICPTCKGHRGVRPLEEEIEYSLPRVMKQTVIGEKFYSPAPFGAENELMRAKMKDARHRGGKKGNISRNIVESRDSMNPSKKRSHHAA